MPGDEENQVNDTANNTPPQTTSLNTKPAPAVESAYTRQELLAASYSAFGVAPEVVAGALHLAGKPELNKTEAKAAIQAFLERKVR